MPEFKKVRHVTLTLTNELADVLDVYMQEHDVQRSSAVESLLWRTKGIRDTANRMGIRRADRPGMGPAKE